MHILVLGYDNLEDSYIFSEDGITKKSASITAPFEKFAKDSIFAVVRGEMFIFGGYSDRQKVTASRISIKKGKFSDR